MAKLAVIKTTQTTASVDDYISTLPTEQQRADSAVLLRLMKKASKEEAKLWGKSMIGFGKLIYKSPATGREVEWFKIGFSPRKANFSLHLVLNIKAHEQLLKKLGKHKRGVGCLYINKLADVDIKVLEQLIQVAAKGKK
jgi:hypothetical protein